MQLLEVELILGAPARIDVYSTLIYRYMRETSPEYGAATVLSVLVLLAILPFVLLQQWLIHRRIYVTLGGKYSGRLQALGLPPRQPLRHLDRHLFPMQLPMAFTSVLVLPLPASSIIPAPYQLPQLRQMLLAMEYISITPM